MSTLPFEPERVTVAPGAVLIKHWLTPEAQIEWAQEALSWLVGPIPAQQPVMPNGALMSVQLACLGWHWLPYKYVKQVNGVEVPPLPHPWRTLARRAALEALDCTDYAPDVALINSYGPSAKMGMHQDKDERSSAPVVSISLGNSCRFRFGNAQSRQKPYIDVQLDSGDLFVFGNEARFAYHGVMRTFANTVPNHLSVLDDQRINLTIRQSGL